jgi:hypothetical protein
MRLIKSLGLNRSTEKSPLCGSGKPLGLTRSTEKSPLCGSGNPFMISPRPLYDNQCKNIRIKYYKTLLYLQIIMLYLQINL